MRRLSVGMVVLVCMALVASAAQAGGKKSKKRAKKDAVPTSEEIAKSLGELKWGMSKDELSKRLIDQVKDEYRPQVAKTHDAVEEDRLRHEAKQKITAIRDSYVEFNGRSTGWDVSFLQGEFTHNNDEAMIVTRDGNSQNFYFFIDGKLWKWYKAFDASTFHGRGFDGFSKVVQKKFGQGKDVTGELSPGEQAHWIEWQDGKTRLRAVDQTQFYGFYCLVFEDKGTLEQLASLRRNSSDKGPKRHALVDSVTGGDDVEADDTPDVVDRITGKNRMRRRPPSREASAAKSSKRGASSASEENRSTGELIGDDDPLKGL